MRISDINKPFIRYDSVFLSSCTIPKHHRDFSREIKIKLIQFLFNLFYCSLHSFSLVLVIFISKHHTVVLLFIYKTGNMDLSRTRHAMVIIVKHNSSAITVR